MTVPPYFTTAALTELKGIRHGFFTRIGGVSSGCFASLNCGYGTGDHPDNVAENRRHAMSQLGLTHDQLVTVHQIHSAKVVSIEKPLVNAQRPQADGLVTNQLGIALGIVTADCAPLLFVDHQSRIIGAAHVGWRGLLAGVIESTIHQMIMLHAQYDRIKAVRGPCITQSSYEVGPEFAALFLDQDRSYADFFVDSERPGHFMFDLPGAIARKITKAGLSLWQHHHDTFTESDSFFSARRAQVQNQRQYGCCLSTIAMLS